MNRIVRGIIVCIYLLVAITITTYLFLFNSFNTSKIGKRYLIASEDIPSYKNGSLLVITSNLNDIEIGDNILFYNVYTTKNKILNEKVISKEQTNKYQITYELENGRYVSSSYVIGNTKDIKVIPYIGNVFSFLSSPIGYLICILLPVFLIFVIQLRIIIKKYNLWGLYD